MLWCILYAESSLLILMNHCSSLEVRFFFVILRMSTGFGAGESGERCVCLLTLHPSPDVSVIASLLKEKKKTRLLDTLQWSHLSNTIIQISPNITSSEPRRKIFPFLFRVCALVWPFKDQWLSIFSLIKNLKNWLFINNHQTYMLAMFPLSAQWSCCCPTLSFSLKRSLTAVRRWSDWTCLHAPSSPPLLFLSSFTVTVCKRVLRLNKEMSGRRNSADLCTENKRAKSLL